MESLFKRQHPTLDSLAELGARGFFPLFETSDTWRNLFSQKSGALNKSEKLKAREIFKRVEKQRTIEKQKIIFSQLHDEEKVIFTKAFFKLVEGKIIDRRPQLQ